MDKLQYIQNIMPNENYRILVRTAGKDQWFVNYLYSITEVKRKSIYRTYTDDLDKALNDVIDIIMKDKLN